MKQDDKEQNIINPSVKNTTLLSIGNRLKFQAGGWWALAFGAFVCLLCFIYIMTKTILQYNLECYKIAPCEKCGFTKVQLIKDLTVFPENTKTNNSN